MPSIAARLRRLGRDVAQMAAEDAATAYAAGYYMRLWQMDVSTPPSQRIAMQRLTPVAATYGALKEQGGETFSQTIYDMLGAEWRDTYALELEDLIIRVQRNLNTGIRAGEGMRPMMNRVADSMGVDIDRRRGAVGSLERKGYRANFNRVQTITRTYVMEASNKGALQGYRENTDVLSYAEHLTARDERVCAECAAMDGELYSLEDMGVAVPPMNTHPNCRCTIIPVIKDDYLSDLNLDTYTDLYSFDDWADLMMVGGLLASFMGMGNRTPERVA